MTRDYSTKTRVLRRPERSCHESATFGSRPRCARIGVRVSAALASVCCAAALLAACGGSSAAPSAGPSSLSPAGPVPLPSPQITEGTPPDGAVAVVRRYWTLLGAHDFDAAFALTTGPHVTKGDLRTTGVESARYVRPVGKVIPSPGDDATVDFGSQVLIVPPATGSPFGTTPRRWLMFSRVVRMSDGSWRLVELGTGP
jgi:hypothetical protein